MRFGHRHLHSLLHSLLNPPPATELFNVKLMILSHLVYTKDLFSRKIRLLQLKRVKERLSVTCTTSGIGLSDLTRKKRIVM